MRRRVLSLLVLLTLSIGVAPLRAAWLTDLGAVKLRVAAENKPALLLFTGSDWCPACQRLQREVFMRPEFASYAEQNLVLLEVDFPHSKPQTAAQKQANQVLAQAYHIRYYPTLILVDPQGHEIERPQYDGHGCQEFLNTLNNAIHNAPLTATRGPRNGSKTAPAPEPPPLFNGAAAAPPKFYADLQLKSISGSAHKRFALINNQTFAAGDVARVKLGDGEVKVRCLSIREDSVQVTVDSQATPRELKLAGNSTSSTPHP